MRSQCRSLAAAFCAALVFALGAAPAAGAQVPTSVQTEVEHLLGYTGNSGCEFYRNGFWFTAKEGENHLRMKYQYLSDIGQIHSAENFIELAGSKSSIIGLNYEVRCNDLPPLASGTWLMNELTRFRAQH